MGFELPDTTTRILFDGGPYEGAEVVMSLDLTMEQAFMLDKVKNEDPEKLVDAMAAYLVEWNITKGGEPVPCTPTELKRRPMPFVMELFKGMRRALSTVVTVDAPFDEPSSNGSTLVSPT